MAACACATAAVGLMTGCGPDSGDAADAADTARSKSAFEDRPVQEIVDAATAATKSASSLTMTMNGVIDGEKTSFHLSLDTKGECKGDIALGGDQGSVKLIRTGKQVYFKFDKAFMKAQGDKDGTMASAIGDHWLRTAATNPEYKDLTEACDLKSLLSDTEEGEEAAVKGKPTTVDGRRVVPVSEKDGAETSTAYIATEGKHYILKIVTKGGKEPGTVTFRDFDKPVDAVAPPAKDVIDLDELGQASA